MKKGELILIAVKIYVAFLFVFLVALVVFFTLVHTLSSELVIYEDASFTLNGCLPWGLCQEETPIRHRSIDQPKKQPNALQRKNSRNTE
jgi:hypothetical protein